MSRALILALCFAAISATATSGRASQDDQREEAKKRLELSLRRSADRFVAAIEKGDSSTVLQMMSRKGVVLGVDYDRTPWTLIQRDFRKRRGVYCWFFDARCPGAAVAAERGRAGSSQPSEPVSSYRDQLQEAAPTSVKVFVTHESWGWSGQVNIYLNERRLLSNGPLEFSYENGRWKLVAIQQY